MDDATLDALEDLLKDVEAHEMRPTPIPESQIEGRSFPFPAPPIPMVRNLEQSQEALTAVSSADAWLYSALLRR